MSQQLVNIGLVPNDGTGDVLRDAFNKTNQNFTEIYQLLLNLPLSQRGGELGQVLTSTGNETDPVWVSIPTNRMRQFFIAGW